MADAVKSKNFNQYLLDLETKLVDVSKTLPALPDNVKEFIVKYGPYITIVLLVLMAPALLAIFGLGTLFAPVSTIFLAVTMVLEIMALPGLFKRQLKSWRLMLYSSLISAVSSLFANNLGSAVIGTAISLYFLFQIRSLYK